MGQISSDLLKKDIWNMTAFLSFHQLHVLRGFTTSFLGQEQKSKIRVFGRETSSEKKSKRPRENSEKNFFARIFFSPPVKTFSRAFLTFLRLNFFSRPFRLPPPTNCPWVSEDGRESDLLLQAFRFLIFFFAFPYSPFLIFLLQ